MNARTWKGLSEKTKRNLCMLPGALMLAAIWLGETINPGKPTASSFQFQLNSNHPTNFVARIL